MCATSNRISASVSVAPKAGILADRFMIAPPPAMVSYNASSDRADIASREACCAGLTGREFAFGPSPFPRSPWHDAHQRAYSAAPLDTGAAALGAGTGASGAGDVAGSALRYRTMRSRVPSGMAVRGIAEPGTTRCGSVTIAWM